MNDKKNDINKIIFTFSITMTFMMFVILGLIFLLMNSFNEGIIIGYKFCKNEVLYNYSQVFKQINFSEIDNYLSEKQYEETKTYNET